MKIRRLRFASFATTCAILIVAATSVVVQRQFAHRSAATANDSDAAASEPSRDNQVVENTAQPRNFASALSQFERKSVKGAPFSAELVIETVQPVQNGPGTLHKSAYIIYRDGEGRTRRDQMNDQTKSGLTVLDQPRRSMLNDLVSGFTYVLDHREHSARRSVLLPTGDQNSDETVASGTAPTAKSSAPYQILPPDTSGRRKGAQVPIAVPVSSHTEKEALGQREIEGVLADGTRLTKTIPAGAFGNQQPISIVVEQWYSPDLQVMVLIKYSDARFGESIYRLTNINRSEPTAKLFEVPGDYKVSDEARQQMPARN